jgi:hypothetical protein
MAANLADQIKPGSIKRSSSTERSRARSERERPTKREPELRFRASFGGGWTQRFQFLGALAIAPFVTLQILDLFSKFFLRFPEFLLEPTEKLVVLSFGKFEVVIG